MRMYAFSGLILIDKDMVRTGVHMRLEDEVVQFRYDGIQKRRQWDRYHALDVWQTAPVLQPPVSQHAPCIGVLVYPMPEFGLLLRG